MAALEELTDLSKAIENTSVSKWKAQGKPIVGYFCSYVPEEIIHAAGILPYRIKARGCTKTTAADTYLSSAMNCSFTRSCLDLALEGEYGFLDGVVSMNSCEHIRRAHDVWKRKIDIPYFHFLSVPHKTDEDAVEWYRDELHKFKKSLESAFNVVITDEALADSIKVYNETRDLLKKLYGLRRGDSPSITGSETLDVVVAATSVRKEDYNGLIKRLLEELSIRKGVPNHRSRLMVIGSVVDDPSYIKLIEDLGSVVVADNLCFGSRYFWEPVDTGSDPLESLARSYLRRPVCPRMADEIVKLYTYTRDMAEEFRVDGVIMERIRCCDLWGGATLLLERRLGEDGIPFLVIDREYAMSGMGQINTRVAAFLEIIGRD
ncbi:MAG: 2-hydroxyacyl-CoA dehydratase family protein [Thermodesulfobacteriota bacterium]